MAPATRWTMRLEPYDPDARDADNDGIVQEQTPWERPAGTSLVDELGRAITRGANAGQRPRGLRVVDQRGNPVDYTPTYERPGFSFGGGGTPLGEAGAPSLRERGLPSVRDITAPPPPPPEPPKPAGLPQGLTPEKPDAPKPDVPEGDYRMTHQPSDDGPRAFDLTEDGGGGWWMPDDVYDKPNQYTGADATVRKETMEQLERVRGNPDGLVTVYRYAPEGREFEVGNWVSLSRTYAQQHGESNPTPGGTVQSMQVPAREVRFAGDDLAEFGWHPEPVKPEPEKPSAPKPTSPTPGSDPAQSSNKVITDPNDVDLYYYPGNRMEDNTWVRREELDESFEDFISGLTDSEKETALRELGFESEDELVRYLTDETLTDVAEQIDSLRKTPIMMALPPDALLSILRDQRFNSQFVTGTSVGGYNPEGRKESEFEKLGVPVDIPDELRPVYGFQVPDDYEGPVTESAAGKIYGSLVVVFKKSPRGRSTMTGGDSVLEDRASAISVDGRVQDEALLGAAREDHYALGQARTENKFFTDVLNSPERQGELIDIESRDYSEVQIHGGATLDEVEKVVFSRRLDAEARAKVVAELEKAGIRYEDDKQ